jgi:hypothetical protein
MWNIVTPGRKIIMDNPEILEPVSSQSDFDEYQVTNNYNNTNLNYNNYMPNFNASNRSYQNMNQNYTQPLMNVPPLLYNNSVASNPSIMHALQSMAQANTTSERQALLVASQYQQLMQAQMMMMQTSLPYNVPYHAMNFPSNDASNDENSRDSKRRRH